MIRTLEVAYHRNGGEGEPFYAIRFLDRRQLLLAIVFERPGRIVVIDPLKAAETVASGVNSWRGDLYEAALRSAVERFEDERIIRPPESRLRGETNARMSNDA
ncbi:hypothetical protein [Sphingomonas koreensis]